MSEKKWVVGLSGDERGKLLGLIRKGNAAARRLTRAHILLLADEGRTDGEIAAALHTNRSTAERVRHRFVEEGLEAVLSDRPRPGAEPVLDPTVRRCCWRWPVPTRPRGGPPGRCNYWPMSWSRAAWWAASRTRPCGAR